MTEAELEEIEAYIQDLADAGLEANDLDRARDIASVLADRSPALLAEVRRLSALAKEARQLVRNLPGPSDEHNRPAWERLESVLSEM